MKELKDTFLPRKDFHCIEGSIESDVSGVFLTEPIKLILIDIKTFSILSSYENYSIDPNKIADHLELDVSVVRDALKEFTIYVRKMELKVPPVKQNTTRIVINVSQDCNLRCTYCYAQGGSYGGQRMLMTKDTADLVCDNIIHAFEIGSRFAVQFFGGEPLLNFEVIEHITKRLESHYDKASPLFSIVSNGTIFNSEIHQFFNDHISTVMLSLDGPKTVNDEYRKGLGNYRSVHDKVVETIRKLNQDRSFTLSIEATYGQVHLEKQLSITNLMEYFASLGVDSALIVPISPPMEFSDDVWPSVVKQFSDAVPYVFRLADKSNGGFYNLRIFNYIIALKRRQYMSHLCSAGVGTYAIGTDGRIYPCFAFVENPSFAVDTIAEGDEEVLLRARKTLKCKMDMDSLKQKNVSCSNCWARSLCNSCLYYLYGKSGNAFLLDENFCILEKTLLNMTFREILDFKQLNPSYWEALIKKVIDRLQNTLDFSPRVM